MPRAPRNPGPPDVPGPADAVVVVPVYRLGPTPEEARALRNVGRVLAGYPVVLVAPAGLNPEPYRRWLPRLGIETFAPEYFAGVRGYNRLMLSDAFYARFGGWEYLLVHQLDAWVFADRLALWCATGYDYVGAPWLRPWHLQPGLVRAFREARSHLYRQRPLDPHHGRARYRLHGLAGNGGLSLRRVTAFRAALAETSPWLEIFRRGADGPNLNEDVFWAAWAGLRLPPWREGLGFAIEHEVPAALAYLGGLPFGCHAWPLLADDWRRVPAAAGMFADQVGRAIAVPPRAGSVLSMPDESVDRRPLPDDNFPEHDSWTT